MIYFKSGRNITHNKYIIVFDSPYAIRIYHRNYNIIVGKDEINKIDVSNMKKIDVTKVPLEVLHKTIMFIFKEF